jgi:large subunit ribosomal protein L21
MDYAVIRSGGKQYRVRPGETVRLEKLAGDPGASHVFTDVLLAAGDGGVKVGKPLLDGIRVTGEIVRHEQGKKILIFKKKRRKNYRRRQGHRQQHTVVRVTGIDTGERSDGA